VAGIFTTALVEKAENPHWKKSTILHRVEERFGRAEEREACLWPMKSDRISLL
jgi:hypothetical protein